MKSLLIIDSAYTLKLIIDRKLNKFITSRDNNKYFHHVWTVHPVDNILDKGIEKKNFGKISNYKINENHTFICGQLGKYYFLRNFKILNFFISQFFLIKYLYKIIKLNNIHYIRSEDPLYNGLIAYFLSKIIYNKKLIICVFGNPDEIRKNNNKPLMPKLFKFIFLEKVIEKFVLRKADMIIVQNHDNKKFVKSKKISDDKIKIFKIGRDIHPSHFIEPKNRKNLLIRNYFNIENKKVITFVSRLIKLKYPHHVMEVLKYLKNKDVNFVAFLVGEGDMKDELVKLCKIYNLNNNVNFVGSKNQEWLASLLSITDLFICPLKGRALIEAALGECPTVAYDIDWHSELITNKENGVIVDFKDIENLSKESLNILLNKKLANFYGKNLRKKALKYSDVSKLIDYENKCYDNL